MLLTVLSPNVHVLQDENELNCSIFIIIMLRNFQIINLFFFTDIVKINSIINKIYDLSTTEFHIKWLNSLNFVGFFFLSLLIRFYNSKPTQLCLISLTFLLQNDCKFVIVDD